MIPDDATVGRLADAVRAGDLVRVRAILAARPELVNMDMAENDERRAIHLSVLDRSPAMVRLLMEHGADARKGIYPQRDATGARTLAVERGWDDIVAVIDEEEERRTARSCANVAAPARDALFAAIRRKDADHAIALLDKDPSLARACDIDGSTPLHAAAAALDGRVVTALLAHGADASRSDARGRTPLDMAAGARGDGFASVAEALRRHGAPMTARAAAALGAVDRLRERHAAGDHENPIDAGSGGLLTIAVIRDRPDTLALLLDFGYDPNERTRLDDVEEVVYSAGFPLWQCAALGRPAMAEMLLARGADPNVQVYASGSSVYSAFSHRQPAMVDILVRRGGIVGADTAAIYRETDLARRMLAGEAETVPSGRLLAEELLEFGASGGDPEIVRMALDRVDWPRDDPRWFRILASPLSFWHHIPWLHAGNPAFDRGTYLACFHLVLARCDPDLIGRFGRTMLHEVASMRDYVTDGEVVAFATALLDARARTDARDDLLRSTPLGWACRWGRATLADLLIRRGADVAEPDAEPWATPWAWAEKRGHDAVRAVLRAHGH